jgi:hypothetical protein
MMKTGKNKLVNTADVVQKINKFNILKTGPSLMLMMSIIFLTIPVLAQTEEDTTVSVYSANDDTYAQMLDYSRPGKYHQLLADLVGTWTFKGRHFEWVDSVTSKVALEYSGKVERKSFANGRFFISEVTSDGTLEMPIQDGKMKEAKFQGLEIEGYDNVKQKFVRNTIGNYLNSAILLYEGSYDSATKTITFDSEFEPVPGMKTKDHFLFIFLDNDHYKWEYYQDENGKYRKGSEIEFTKAGEK